MSEEQVVARVRGPRRRVEVIQQLVREFETSGQTRVEFCHSHALSVSTLDRYLRRYRTGEVLKSNCAGSGLVPVEIAMPNRQPAERALAVILPRGRKVEVGVGFDATTLARIVAVLEQR
jgi:hypothetical protein